MERERIEENKRRMGKKEVRICRGEEEKEEE